LLGEFITWNIGPEVSIGTTPLLRLNENFSQGQKWLLHFAASIYADVAVDDPFVLCLDEPELHLHPAAANQILDILTRTLVGGQIIIATHSIPLIAHVGYESTWFVQNGQATYAGRKPEHVIAGLVGGLDGIAKLKGLLSEPDAAAISRFALESLLAPAVADARSSDPQALQILTNLRKRRETLNRPLRIMDYGAGKGRILDIATNELGEELIALFDYYAFEPHDETAEICERTIARIYGTESDRVFRRKSLIAEATGGKQFDLVILCNVLHEISPSDWSTEFAFIKTLVDENGEVLIVEDLLLPHGENAHSEGFVVASKEALRHLFAIDSEDSVRLRDTRSDLLRTEGRLMCVSIPAKFVGQVSANSTKSALTYIRDHAKLRIQEIRSANHQSYVAGLEHALYLHQFANSTFALHKFGEAVS
jgi:energy-coupling factor transporter ATP-binding protein EcfA2